MNVLITGGAGYIGTSLCHELANRKDVERVAIYDNLSRPNYNLLIGKQKLDNRFSLIEADILDSRNLRKAVAQADVVFHLAAKVTTPFADQNAHLYDQVNNWGSAELSYAIENSKIHSVISLSSVSVYGIGEDWKNIHTEPNPQSFYGISKLQGEKHLERLSEICGVHIFRCGNVYGYNRSVRFDAVINRFMIDAHFKGKINVHGTGTQHRPFIHIDTVAKQLCDAIDKAKGNSTQNLVEDNFSINEIVGTLGEIYPNLEVISMNQNMRMRELLVSEDEDDSTSDLMRLKARLELFGTQFTF